MNQFMLPITELKPALTGLGKVLLKQTHQPVLSTIRLERTPDGWVTLTATDGYHFATVRLEQPTDEDPEVLLIPYEELQRTVKSCGKDDEILIDPDGPNLVSIKYVLGNQLVEHKVESYPVEEFPEIPRIEGEAIPASESLRDSIHQAFECASTDETRLILNGAYLDVEDAECHYVVATDGRHLFSSNSFTLPLEKSVILPAHRFLQWREFSNRDGEWKIQVTPGNSQNDPARIQISSRRWRFITSEIEGNYPNWKQVIPNSSDTKSTFEVEPQAVEQVIQTIQRMPCHDSVNFAIGLELTGNKVLLLGRSGTPENWTKVEVPTAKITGKPVMIFLNRNFLTKALRFGLTRVELIDPMSPLRFSDGGRQMIVMPTRADSVPPTPVSTAVPEQNGTGAADPVNSGTDQPTAKERNTMLSQNTPTASTDGTSPALVNSASKIEEALELIDGLKESLQDGLTGLKDLSGKLKQIQREQKSTEREFQSIRSTLRTLQSVKL